MNQYHYHANITKLGIPDTFIEHGTPGELYHECGFDAGGIAKTIKHIIDKLH
jgi:1-deoxy-D-xylulose-5-phosphate synthase